jgi:uncharacterized BrkB/YihY/UPF0761 family membrane protein
VRYGSGRRSRASCVPDLEHSDPRRGAASSAGWCVRSRFFLVAALFAVAYKTVPDVRLKWSDVVLGAAITSLFFMLGKELIALYFAQTSIRSTYGTAGSPFVVLLWVY